MWWGKGQDKPREVAKEVEPKPNGKDAANTGRSGAEFDPEKLPRREKLPDRLQKIIEKSDDEENFFDEVVDGYAPPTTDSNIRYAAYTTRFRTILVSARRYVAYTSDIGESFRPVAHRRLIRAAYGVSWAYILGDVSYEGYRAYWHNQRILNPQLELTPRQRKVTGLPDPVAHPELPEHGQQPGVVPALQDYRTVMAQRALFQGLASMGLPALTIHSIVRYSGRAMKDIKNTKIRTWGPIGLGLSVVPFLPKLFDKPVENAVEWLFHKSFATVGGKEAVGEATAIGRERQLDAKPPKPKEKEL